MEVNLGLPGRKNGDKRGGKYFTTKIWLQNRGERGLTFGSEQEFLEALVRWYEVLLWRRLHEGRAPAECPAARSGAYPRGRRTSSVAETQSEISDAR